MKRRESLHAPAALILAASITGCGPGGSAATPPAAPAGAILVRHATPVQLRQLPRHANYWQVITSGQTKVDRGARKEHAAAYLANGKVLLIGGGGEGGWSIASVDVLE